jgi:uncharacterized protein YbjT (DUF2867 family)
VHQLPDRRLPSKRNACGFRRDRESLRLFADKERQEQILRSSSLEWTIVQPAALSNGPRTGAYHVGQRACVGRLLPRVSRADVAHFMLEELTRGGHVRQAVAICS